MSDSHITCESCSILTRACRKPSPVAFALHLSIDGSATYPGTGETLCARRSGGRMKRWLLAGTLALAASGQAVASDLPPPASAPPRAPAAYVPPPSPVYNWGGIYSASISATASARAFGAIPSIPAGRPAISTCGAFSPASRSAQISRPTHLCVWRRVGFRRLLDR